MLTDDMPYAKLIKLLFKSDTQSLTEPEEHGNPADYHPNRRYI